MASAKIKWNQKVAGRDEGHVEICEIDTPFMQGCLKNRRYEILEIIEPPKVLKLNPTPNEKPKPRPVARPKDDGEV